MKKIILSLIVGLTAILLGTNVFASQQATLFHPYTGERKVVEVGEPNVFDGGWVLETQSVNYISYWVDRLTNENAKPITDEELKIIPEEAWYQITPQIINQTPRTSGIILGSDGQPEVVAISVCRGDDCLLYQEDPLLGYSVVSRYRTRLSSSMTSTQSTVPVSSMESFDGTTLTMALLGDKVFLVLEPGSSREEIVKCEAISSTTWTTCTRGLAFTGTAETSVAANRKAHNAGSIVVMSNVHYVYEQLPDKDTTETFTGQKFFDIYPEITGTAVATTSRQLITFDQANNLTNQGAATSTETTSGISELATQKEMASSTDNGVNFPLVLQGRYASSTPSTENRLGLFVPVSENDGYLSQLWLDLTEAWSFTGNFKSASSTFTGNSLFTGNSTSTASAVFQSDVSITGNATSTGTFDFSNLCFGNSNCMTNIANSYSDAKNEMLNKGYTTVQPGFYDMTTAGTGGSVGIHLNQAALTSGASSGNEIVVKDQLGASGAQDFDQDLYLIYKVKNAATTAQDIFIGYHDTDMTDPPDNCVDTTRHVAFCVIDNTLTATVADGTTQETATISGYTLTNYNTYEIVFVSGTSAQFWVNGTLEATLSTNDPTGPGGDIYLVFAVETQTTADRIVTINNNWAAKVENE